MLLQILLHSDCRESHADEQTELNEVKRVENLLAGGGRWGGFHGDSSIPQAHRDYPAMQSASTSSAQIRKQMQ